ncbi:Hypothetical protein SMAX5B_014438 [Scophthalmus maximus]|uniref:Uncharacterized protein n=1 Tax=Scophthalmus maximus TaxID=52904 RepID=A0A2U9C1K8_SCOMX|nr:Hypothetical protein SMAX5B_014438 [Scophthalmus maximus]
MDVISLIFLLGQPLPAAHGGGRGLDVSASGVRRQRRDLRNLLPYEEQMMSYNAAQGGGGSNDLYYQSDDLRGRGLNQALQQLVERDQRREQEEGERADYDETGQGMRMGRPPGAWWGLLEPQLAQALLDRGEPQLAQTLLERARQERLQQTGRGLNRDQDTLR